MVEFTQTEELSAELLKAETEAKEAKELRAQNSTLIRKGQHQHEEIRRLNKVRSREPKGFHVRVEKAFSSVCSLQHQLCYSCFHMFVQALEEALQTAQPVEASRETLLDVWKHQVSFDQS